MSKKAIWVIILIILIVLVVWLWRSGVEAPVEGDPTATSTEESIDENDVEEQLEGINVEDVEGEFDGIDEDLENL
ncbi:MAG: hypothetical protein WD471_00470 [Candidatus Paceibacterota bacterium]